MTTAVRIRWILGALLACGLAAFVLSLRSSETEYREFISPDGSFRVVVFKRALTFGAMPGQSGDAPGTVRLYDKPGRLLAQKKVDMVQLVDSVEWEPETVHIKLIADWALPKQP